MRCTKSMSSVFLTATLAVATAAFAVDRRSSEAGVESPPATATVAPTHAGLAVPGSGGGSGSRDTDDCMIDDGSSENGLGLTDGGDMAWIQECVADSAATVVAVSTVWGNTGGTPGVSPGDTVRVYVWSDPTQDGDPCDAVLECETYSTADAGSIGTDVLQKIFLTCPVGVAAGERYFIGASVVHVAGTFPAALDETAPAGVAWLGYVVGGVYDPNNIGGQEFCPLEMGSINFPSNFLLRANTGVPSVCGDGVCDGPEDCCNCAADCGSCTCGDGTCDGPCEDCGSCSSDCGECSPCLDAVGDCCDLDGNGSPGCDLFDCCEAICALDAWCCEIEWDSTCGAYAGTTCPLCSGKSVPVPIATGSNSSIDGYLMVAPDGYGSWASVTYGGGGDSFNPAGSYVAREAAFSAGIFLFVGETQRELLSDNSQWQDCCVGGTPFGNDPSLNRTITSVPVASDTNGDGVDDNLVSAFDITGAGTNLSFGLTQQVYTVASGVSVLQQDFQITNNGGAIDLVMVNAFDGDLMWVGSYDDDAVGTFTNGMPELDPFVFQQEERNPATAVTISSPQGGAYYGGRLGTDPDGGGLPYNYGTDLEIWEAYGVPDGSGLPADMSDWRKHIANVGYNVDGTSGASPPGCPAPGGDPCDGFIGLGMTVSIPAAGEATVTVYHTYGANTPIPSGSVAIVSSDPPDGAVDGRRPASLDDACATPAGWAAIDITFDGDAGGVVAGDFTITVNPADVTPPSITGVSSAGNTASLTLNGIVPTSHWTTFTHDASGTSTTLGNLPADVNGDGTNSTVDVLDLIDHLNGVISLPERGTDSDRSGATNSADILTAIDLLNGAGCFDSWLGASLP